MNNIKEPKEKDRFITFREALAQENLYLHYIMCNPADEDYHSTLMVFNTPCLENTTCPFGLANIFYETPIGTRGRWRVLKEEELDIPCLTSITY